MLCSPRLGTLSLPLLALLPALASAQNPTLRSAGRVSPAAGQALPENTRVHLVGSPQLVQVPGEPTLRNETPLARGGRFVVRLPEGSYHSIWAEAELPDGKKVFSNVIEELAAGEVAILRMQSEARSQRPLQLSGADAWKHRGPFRIRVWPSGRFREPLELSADESGIWTLPPLPGSQVTVEVASQEGRAIQILRASLDTSGAEEKPDDPLELTLTPPLQVSMTVLDKKTKKPVADARVSYQSSTDRPHPLGALVSSSIRPSFLDCGRTDAEGKVTLELPWKWTGKHRPWNGLTIEADGYMTGAARLTNSGRSDFELQEKESGPPDIKVFLTTSPDLHGRVLDAAGKPLAGLLVLSEHCGVYYKRENGMSWMTLMPRWVRTGADGRFRLSGLTQHGTTSLFAIAPPALRERLQKGLGADFADFPLGPMFPLWSGHAKQKEDENKIDLGDLRSSEWKATRLRIERPGGRAARNARVLFKSGSGDEIEVSANRDGKITLLLQPGTFELVVYSEGEGWALEQGNVQEWLGGSAERTLVLEPFHTVRGRVLAGEEPVEGARLELQLRRATGSYPRLVRTVIDRVSKARSGADGVYELPFIPWPTTQYAVRATFRDENRRFRQGRSDQMVSSESLKDVEVRLSGK